MSLPQPDDRIRQLPDAQLALEVARGDSRGDKQAMAELYHRHARAMLAVAFHILQSREDAEDVVHDVFVGLPEALRRYDERGALGAWLRKVTARVALMRLRQENARRTDPLDGASDRALDDGNTTASADEGERTITIERAMQRLSPSLRAVLVLKEIEGFTHAEIAGMLDISVGASEVRLHRALRTLRAMLIGEKGR